jgi:hypothetical protein
VHTLGRKILLSPHAAEAPLQPVAQLLARCVAPVDTAVVARLVAAGDPKAGGLSGGIAVASLPLGSHHLDAIRTEVAILALHLLGVALNGVGRFTLALKIIRVIWLRRILVSNTNV